ncbi:Putative Nucleoside diphosphate kinase [[Torrubiella] hemipterigena]|uniref:Nucleoside diphosphate kinase n=1 Tax=[Torrubiella] hemipterigena TaxID=1531966 RepID=A0A0A1TH17_9HYPO|nr:Putative Nucleoside diphosphate kinase [[Torrubiella] hemipterigena]
MAEPLHEHPALDKRRRDSQNQRGFSLLRPVTVTLPPPISLVPILFFLFYFFSSSFSSQPNPCIPSVSQSPDTESASSVPFVRTDTFKPSKMSSTEQTFIAIKPDGVQRGLIGPIVSRFENRGFKLTAIKLVTPSKEHLETHYADLKGKPFFPGLIEYMGSGPICAMVWEGRDAVKTGRTILGATNPLASAPGTIRGDFAIDVGRNVCHGSDSVENAQKEIALWFKEGELVSYKASQFDWIYEKA